MSYQINFGPWGGIFAVPTVLADQHLKFCSERQLKVLLLALRDAPNPVDIRYIAKRLSLRPDEVCDALDYWMESGLFSQSTDSPSVAASNSPYLSNDQQAPCALPPSDDRIRHVEEQTANNNQRIAVIHSRARLTPAQISEMCKNDPNVPLLLQELQQRLGSALSPAQTEALLYSYSYFSLTPDYLLMVAEYCKSIGKGDVHQIVKFTTAWAGEGINTHQSLENHLKLLSARNIRYNHIQQEFGISGRSLSSKEKHYIDCWYESFHFSDDIIALAYERTIDNTTKLSFAYLNKILSDWFEKGVSTIQQAHNEMASSRKPKPEKITGEPQPENRSYDLSDIRQLIARDGS